MITGKIEGKIQREDTGIRTAGDPNIAIHQAADRSQRQKEPPESLSRSRTMGNDSGETCNL